MVLIRSRHACTKGLPSIHCHLTFTSTHIQHNMLHKFLQARLGPQHQAWLVSLVLIVKLSLLTWPWQLCMTVTVQEISLGMSRLCYQGNSRNLKHWLSTSSKPINIYTDTSRLHAALSCLTAVSWLGYAAVESPTFLGNGEIITQLTKLPFIGKAPGSTFVIALAVQPA